MIVELKIASAGFKVITVAPTFLFGAVYLYPAARDGCSCKGEKQKKPIPQGGPLCLLCTKVKVFEKSASELNLI